MYPFQSERPYLKRQWHAAAWSHEIGRELLERTILDEPVVLYRTEAGGVAALHGVCPHRMLPLVRGTLVGDQVACAYHGFQFDPAGRCTRIPTQAQAPTKACLQTFPVREHGGMVWLWMGEPERCNDTPLPDLGAIGMDNAAWAACGHSRTRLQARWALLLDNLFDLTHIGWVHARTIGTGMDTNEEGVAKVVLVPPSLEDDGQRLVLGRSAKNCPLDPFHRFLHPGAPDRLDLDLYSDLLSPTIINAGTRTLDSSTGRLLGNLNFIHIITPETAHSCHYFGVVTRDFRQSDEALSAALAAQDAAVRAEDRDIVEAVERNAPRYGDTRREISALADAGAIRLRRRIDALLQAEESDDPAPAPRCIAPRQ